MLAAVQKAGVVHMICHNYRRAPAVMLAKQLIDEGRLGRLYHYRGTYLQDWVADPACRSTGACRRKSELGRTRRHRVALARPRAVSGRGDHGGHAALETFVKERPLPDNPKKKGPVTVDDASASIVRFENGALGQSRPQVRDRAQELQPLRDQRSKGSVAFDLERMNELEVYLTDDDKSVQGFHTVMVTEPHHPYFKAWWPAGHIIGYEHTFIHTVYDLLQAVAANKVPTPSRTVSGTSACSPRWRSRQVGDGG